MFSRISIISCLLPTHKHTSVKKKEQFSFPPQKWRNFLQPKYWLGILDKWWSYYIKLIKVIMLLGQNWTRGSNFCLDTHAVYAVGLYLLARCIFCKKYYCTPQCMIKYWRKDISFKNARLPNMIFWKDNLKFFFLFWIENLYCNWWGSQ